MSEELIRLLTAWGLKVAGAIAVLAIGMMVARAVRGAVGKALRKNLQDETLVPFVSGLVYYAVVAFVLIAVLGLFGVQVASMIAVLGAAAFAVGMALQGTLSNFAAGIMLLLFRPFRVKDSVDIGGTRGSVAEIGIFSTTLNTPDNVRVVVPNSNIWGQTIKNFAANDTRRNDMVIGVGYSDDLDKAAEVLMRVLKSDDRVLANPEPVVVVSELGDSSVNFALRPWCKKEDYGSLRSDLLKKIKVELEAAGLSIPFPQRDVHLYKVGQEG